MFAILQSITKKPQMPPCKFLLNFSSYIQGQEPEPKVREYFYYIDHQGMLFLDDARMKNFTSCFKDKLFLQFFFKRLRINESGRYPEFPYLSICGRERNFVRCDDFPVVFNCILRKDNEEYLSHNHAGDLLLLKFNPDKVCMFPETGRVYHPAPEKVGGVGLISSLFAIELSKYFIFDNGEHNPPTHLHWNNTKNKLDQEWHQQVKKKTKHSVNNI